MPHEEFRDDHTPLAIFITFRTYGSWLHGDPRGSVDRFHNRYGSPRLPPNKLRQNFERNLLKRPPVQLNRRQREAAKEGIKEICEKRNWGLWAVNVRTNHVHVVVTVDCDSKKARAALKASATKLMRDKGTWSSPESPWAAKGSLRKLWTEAELIATIDYVMYDQGE